MLPVHIADFSDQDWRYLVPSALIEQIGARLALSRRAPVIRVLRLLGAVIGCAICLPEADDTGELVLVAVTARMRRRGIGTTLLRAVEAAARELGLSQLTATWSDAMEAPGPVGNFLAQAGWGPVTRSGIAVRMAAEDGIGFLTPLAARMPACRHAVAPWTALSATQRQDLLETVEMAGSMPPGLHPFLLEDRADPELSLALVADDGRVLGWHLARWAAPDRAWVLAGYGLPEALGAPCFLRMWIRFFEQVARAGARTPCGWDTHASLHPMMRFLLRRRATAPAMTQGRWSSSRRLAPQMAEAS